jgi:hypothetical protein
VFADDLSRNLGQNEDAVVLLQLRDSEQDAHHPAGNLQGATRQLLSPREEGSRVLRHSLLPQSDSSEQELDPRLMASFAEAMRLRGRREENCLRLVHIPKTAGTSFRTDFAEELGGGHAEECLFRNYHPNCTIMFFHSPRDHVLSQFVHCIENPLYRQGVVPLPNELTADLMTGFPLWLHHFMGPEGKSACPQEGGAEAEDLYTCRTRVDFKCYNPNNMQGRHLVCTRSDLWGSHYIGDEGPTPDATLAEEHLRMVEHVGITELYGASVCLMMTKWSGTISEGCGCGPGRTQWQHITRGNTPHEIESYSDDILQKVDALTQVDRIIYEAALARLVDEIREVEEEHNEKLLCDDDKNNLRHVIEYLPGLADRLGI